jgi:hypothetical protein
MLVMHSKQSVRTFIVTMCLVLLAISTSCASTENHRYSKNFTPEYTPIVIISAGTTLPSDGTLVSIEDLVAQPQKYADQFIEARGFNAGGLAKPACSPYFGPPSEWALMAAPYIHYPDGAAGYEPPMIEIKNAFDGIVGGPSDVYGRAIYNVMMKKAAVWGWWRLYKGPIGCEAFIQSTPKAMQNQQTWYLDAVNLQWLESIAVPTPEK